MSSPWNASNFARFSWGVLGYNLLVIAWGAFVRATGAGAGCGSHWPDCNGEIIPRADSVETAIEFTHRITSGLALIAVVVQLVWAVRLFERGHVVRRSSVASLVLMLIEAALGAGLVLLELVADDSSVGRAVMTALHLMNTFLLVAAIALTAWWSSPARVPERIDAGGGLGTWLALGAAALILTGMAGAVTALGDTLFPAASLAEGIAADASPTAHFLVRLRVVHPVLAVGTFLFLGILAGLVASQRPDARVKRGAIALVTALGAQMIVGVVNLALLAPVAMQLVHLLLADAVWIALVLLGATALGTPREQRARAAIAA